MTQHPERNAPLSPQKQREPDRRPLVCPSLALPWRDAPASVETSVAVTDLAAPLGYRVPVWVMPALWRDLHAVPVGFRETPQERLTAILRIGADLIQRSPRQTRERLCAVTLPVQGAEISDYPVLFFVVRAPNGALTLHLASVPEDVSAKNPPDALD